MISEPRLFFFLYSLNNLLASGFFKKSLIIWACAFEDSLELASAPYENQVFSRSRVTLSCVSLKIYNPQLFNIGSNDSLEKQKDAHLDRLPKNLKLEYKHLRYQV